MGFTALQSCHLLGPDICICQSDDDDDDDDDILMTATTTMMMVLVLMLMHSWSVPDYSQLPTSNNLF